MRAILSSIKWKLCGILEMLSVPVKKAELLHTRLDCLLLSGNISSSPYQQVEDIRHAVVQGSFAPLLNIGLHERAINKPSKANGRQTKKPEV
eukprot:scaffold296387_cov30-Prasinocladus_malaysianus.AAC.1